MLIPGRARRPGQRGGHPPARRRPRARHRAAVRRGPRCSSPTPSTRSPHAASCRSPSSPTHRLLLPPPGSALRRVLDRAAGGVGVQLGPRPRSTACACSPRWPSTATARRSSRRPRCRSRRPARFGVVRGARAAAARRRPRPPAPARRPSAADPGPVRRAARGRRRAGPPAARRPPRHERLPAQPGDLIARRGDARLGSPGDVTRRLRRRHRAPARHVGAGHRRGPRSSTPASARGGSCGSSRRRDRVGVPRRAAVVDDRPPIAERGGAGPPAPSACRSSCVMASSGADIVEGIAALEGWGRLAKALVDCSGVVPTIVVVDGPAVSGPALLLGVADLVVMTEASYALRQRPGDGRGVHRRADRRPTSSAAPASWPATPACRRSSWPTGTAAIEAVGDLLAYLPEQRRRGAAALADRRPGRPAVPGGRRADPADVDRQLRRAPGGRGDRRRRQPARAARPLGGQRGDRVRDDRRAPDRHRRQPAALARRHAGHPGVAEGGPLRRRSATPSTCRSSRSSTRPASTPARTSSGGA